MSETVVKQRGRTSIELKLRHILPKELRRRFERYRVDLHLFLPHAFAVSPETYGAERFYEDAKLYVRFNTPGFTIERILDPECEDSPLARLDNMLKSAASDVTLNPRSFVYESKLLGAVMKSVLRDAFGGMSDVMTDPDVAEGEGTDEDDDADDTDDDPQSETGAHVAELSGEDLVSAVRSVHEIAKRFHRIRKEVVSREDLSALHQHTRMIDEHISLLIEKYFTAFVNYHDLARTNPDLYPVMSKVVIKEADYRASSDYPTVLPEPGDTRSLEQYVYREKMLKKYTSEVLFFRVKTTNEARRVEHLLYALAAGIAMVFATAIAFFGQTVFGGISLSLFLVLVAGYMLKDRIKDFFRDFFRRSLAGRIYDRREFLYDSVWRKRIASLRERANYVRPEDEVPAVLDLRARGPFEAQLSVTEAETHLMYRKVVTVHARTIRKVHRRIRGLADITILNLSHLFENLTAQSAPVPVVVGKKAIDVITAQRVYHLNLIVCHRTSSRETRERFRLIVGPKGIKRIEAAGRTVTEVPVS